MSVNYSLILVATVPIAERLGPLALEILAAIYFFVLGATVGSFLNVVVYRLPRGVGLLRPGSFCPACRTPIRARDNLPVLGWLLLRGRCRQCHAPISARYPLVELVLGLVFLGLAYAELISGGANLPAPPQNLRAGAVWTLWSPAWSLIGLYLYHCVLISVLAALLLIKTDGRSTPVSLVVFGLAAGLAPPILWPQLRAVTAASTGPFSHDAASWMARWVDGCLDLSVGWLLGSLFALGRPAHARGQRRFEGTTLSLVLASVYLGWRAAMSVTVMAAVARLLVVATANCRGRSKWLELPPVVFPLAAVLVQIPAWRWLNAISHWPSSPGGVPDVVAGALLICATSLAARWSSRPPRAPNVRSDGTS
jgi:leader peptidase (prepilin peptidase) / N-methyltransferase